MTTLDRLRRLSSAEEFFAALDVPYDPHVLHVARLHVLRRMGEWLAHEDFAGLGDDEIRSRCALLLREAHDAFVHGSPVAARLFKVHRDAVRERTPQEVFVPLSVLTEPRRS